MHTQISPLEVERMRATPADKYHYPGYESVYGCGNKDIRKEVTEYVLNWHGVLKCLRVLTLHRLSCVIGDSLRNWKKVVSEVGAAFRKTHSVIVFNTGRSMLQTLSF